jgi:HD-like signal output (HDOD) protein
VCAHRTNGETGIVNLIVLGVLLLAAAAVAWWCWPSRAARTPAAPSLARSPTRSPAASPATAATRTAAAGVAGAAGATPASLRPATGSPAAQPAPEVPALLAAYRPTALGDLSADQQGALADALRRIPRPPPALQQLTSPAFLEGASSAQLSELIMAEGRVAAQVLAAVNAPFYGLRQPVASVGQAVTFLGLNTVRSICLKALLEASFNVSDPALRRQFDTIGRASAFASELCARLAPKLGLPSQGTLVTQVVLSFLGPMAVAALMAREQPDWSLSQDLLTRSEAEQARLGLAASALGGLLLHLWGLPASIADEVAAIDSILVTPAAPNDPPQVAQRALCYLCARLGERLATGALTDLAAFDPMADHGESFFHLQGHLQTPALARLGEQLRATDIGHALTAVSRNMRG